MNWVGGADEEMLTVETISKIRLAHRDGKPLRKIARDLRLSRNTVRKIIRTDVTELRYDRSVVHRPKPGPYLDTLVQCLEADSQLPVKRRRSAQLLYEALQEAGYRGAYDSVRRYVKRGRSERGQTPRDGIHSAYV